jgi:lipid-binding SYLF domain-containing protein
MKMASAGANIGGGIKYLQVIFIFPTETALNKFINDGWSADADASAVGGDDSSQAGITLADGTKIYQLVDTGIMLKASVGGTKYWKDPDLN